MRSCTTELAGAVLTALAIGCDGTANRLPASPPAEAAPLAQTGSSQAAAPERAATGRLGRAHVRVRGVIAADGSQVSEQPAPPGARLEICPGDALRPCSGVAISGSVPAELVSSRERVVVVQLAGLYDGAAIELAAPAERAPLRAEPDWRNPCPEHQAPVVFRGDGNPRPALEEVAARLEREQADRFAGAWWDRQRQTFTVRVTGDAGDLASRYAPPSPRDRLCIAGGAKHSMRRLLGALERVSDALEVSRAWLTEAGPNIWSNRLELRLEHSDAALLERVRQLAGVDVDVESFIELTDGSLAELPQAPSQGDIPLLTSPRRWSYGGMHALGHFAVRLDAAMRCVYLEGASGRRVLPFWPHGYFARSSPLRVFDFDGREVSKAGALQPFSGGHLALEELTERPRETCGAVSGWSGTPSDG